MRQSASGSTRSSRARSSSSCAGGATRWIAGCATSGRAASRGPLPVANEAQARWGAPLMRTEFIPIVHTVPLERTPTKEPRMPELDRYIPGVPCWTDHSSADPAARRRSTAGCSAGSSRRRCRVPPSTCRRGSAAAWSPPSARRWATRRRRCGALTSGSTARTTRQPRCARPAAASSASRWTSSSWPDGVLRRPGGRDVGVWQPSEHRGAAVVNEHGSVNFNGLHTRDLEGAKAFYGAVFGWGALPMGMWALPAYGDHLERSTPARARGRRSSAGGPLRGGGRRRQRDRRRSPTRRRTGT